MLKLWPRGGFLIKGFSGFLLLGILGFFCVSGVCFGVAKESGEKSGLHFGEATPLRLLLQEYFYQIYVRTYLDTTTASKEMRQDTSAYLQHLVRFLLGNASVLHLNQEIMMGEDLILRNSRHPMVLFGVGCYYREAGQLEQAAACLEEALAEVQQRSYEARVSFEMAIVLAEIYKAQQGEMDSQVDVWRGLALEWMLNALHQGEYGGENIRVLFHRLHHGSRYWPEIFNNEFYDLYGACYESPRVPAWFQNMLGGLYWFHASEEVLKERRAANRKLLRTPIYVERLEQAEYHFGKAHQLESLYPEASLALVWVLGRSNNIEKATEWFDRTMRMDPGNIEAYRVYLDVLKNAESLVDSHLQKLSRRCLESRQYPPIVPLFYLDVVQCLLPPTQFPAILRNDSYRSDSETLFQGILKQSLQKGDPDYEIMIRHCLAWLNQEYATGKELLIQGEGELRSSIFPTALPYARIAGEFMAATSTESSAFEVAEQYYQKGKMTQAGMHFLQLVEKAPDLRSRLYAWERARACIPRLAQEPPWISVMPDAELAEWDMVHGIWSVTAPNEIKGVIYDGSSYLNSRIPFEGAFEVRGEIRFPTGSKTIIARIRLPFAEEVFLSVNRFKEIIEVGPKGSDAAMRMQSVVRNHNTFFLRMHKDRSTLVFNGQKLWIDNLIVKKASWLRFMSGKSGFVLDWSSLFLTPDANPQVLFADISYRFLTEEARPTLISDELERHRSWIQERMSVDLPEESSALEFVVDVEAELKNQSANRIRVLGASVVFLLGIVLLGYRRKTLKGQDPGSRRP